MNLMEQVYHSQEPIEVGKISEFTVVVMLKVRYDTLVEQRDNARENVEGWKARAMTATQQLEAVAKAQGFPSIKKLMDSIEEK